MDDVFGELKSQVVTTKRDDLDKAFVRCFSTEAGQTVLEYLRNMTIEQPTWYPGEEASHGFAREGQNSLVRHIEDAVHQRHHALCYQSAISRPHLG